MRGCRFRSAVCTPIFYGHAQLVHLKTLRPIAAEEARVALAAGEGLTLSDELDYLPDVGRRRLGERRAEYWLSA